MKLIIKDELEKYKQKIDDFHHKWCNSYLKKDIKIVSEFKVLIKKIERQKMKELMLAQLLGFRLGKGGFQITELVSSAGLTKDEWYSIKDETDISSLEDSDITDIENYVNDLKDKYKVVTNSLDESKHKD